MELRSSKASTIFRVAALVICGLALSIHGTSQETSTRDNAAHEKIVAALNALGGSQQIAAISSIIIETSGREHRSAEEQGYDPERETDTPHQEVIVAFPGADRFLYEHKTGRHDGTTRWRRWSYIDDERTVADFVERFASVRKTETAITERLRRARRVPHLLLLEAEKNSSRLSYDSEQNFRGRMHDVISYAMPSEKTTLKLFLDSKTHLLTKYEYLMDLPSRGDVLVEQIYGPYRKHQQLGWFPDGDRIVVAGKPWREVGYQKLEVNTPRAATLFDLPDDIRQQMASPGSVSELAKGVFLVNSLGSLNPLFIEFNDFVLAVEAPIASYSLDAVPADSQPGSSNISEQFIKIIKDKIPGKPIKFLVVTHSHSDHAGGARAFIAEGATILTTPGNKLFFERMAKASHRLVPDRLSREVRALKLETFGSRFEVTDGKRRVELINVGANPHTAESVVVYLPEEKILYQGDLFYFDGEGTFPSRSRTTVMPFFANWLVKSRLTPERIYGAHDRGYATMEHVRRMLTSGTQRGQ